VITTNNTGFTEAKLRTECEARLFATKSMIDNAFRVTTDGPGNTCGCGWSFDEEACREAAEFFTKLADELARSKNAE